MELYLVRHGQSEANARITTALDSDLTPTGRAQANLTAARMRTVGLTEIYVSPFRRTLETVSYICDAVGLSAEVQAETCEYFSEHVLGDQTFSGMSPEAIEAEFPSVRVGSTFGCGIDWWPKDVEDHAALIARANRVREAVVALFGSTDHRILIVSHAEPIGRMIESFLRIKPDPWEPPWTDNCGIWELAVPADPAMAAEVVTANDVDHLGEWVT